MYSRKTITNFAILVPLLLVIVAQSTPAKSPPIIYSTDLFHPPDDPDDHFDLATLFALPELDIRAVILDLGQQQRKESGAVPLRQMMHLTGRKVAFANGLSNPLKHPEDKGLDQFVQEGPNLILKILEEAEQPVYLITTGSVRDVAAAYNRRPDVFAKKVARIYVNAGNAAGGDLYWNPRLDPQAYMRLMTSDLPIYWAPCFGGMESLNDLATRGLPVHTNQEYWHFRQGDLFDAIPARLRNFFLYALTKKNPETEDPIAFLDRPPQQDPQLWNATRHMWSTVTLYHAAGRRLYKRGNEWVVLAEPAKGDESAGVFDFVRTGVTIDRDLRTKLKDPKPGSRLQIFRVLDAANYEKAMFTSLRHLLVEMPLK